MQQPKLEPEPVECACGRNLADASVVAYSSARGHCLYHRCQCGAEWTECHAELDKQQPISSDELLDLHQRLADFEGPIQELLGNHR